MRRLLLLCVVAGCEDVPQPFELDHARVMAVRIDPPAIAAGGLARIDVLVTDSAEVPYQAAPVAIKVRLPAELARPELASFIANDGASWTITAPDASTLAQVRVALSLAPDAPVIVPLELEVDTVDGPLTAQKTVALGMFADNPAAPAITLDGAHGELVIPIAKRSMLGVDPVDDALSYRWFSSVGDLVGFTRAEARIEPEVARDGTIVVVVRDQAGGTAWSIASVRVQ